MVFCSSCPALQVSSVCCRVWSSLPLMARAARTTGFSRTDTDRRVLESGGVFSNQSAQAENCKSRRSTSTASIASIATAQESRITAMSIKAPLPCSGVFGHAWSRLRRDRSVSRPYTTTQTRHTAAM